MGWVGNDLESAKKTADELTAGDQGERDGERWVVLRYVFHPSKFEIERESLAEYMVDKIGDCLIVYRGGLPADEQYMDEAHRVGVKASGVVPTDYQAICSCGWMSVYCTSEDLALMGWGREHQMIEAGLRAKAARGRAGVEL